MPGETVLVVDDNPLNLKLLRFVLTKEGYEVREARDADEVRAEVARALPAVILMDVQLPGTDGLELTRELKASGRTQGVPVIAVTAYAMKGDEAKARDAGCDGYVTKPIDTRALGGILARLLDGTRVTGGPAE